MWEVAPLSKGFMAVSIVGFLFSALWLYPRNQPYGGAFMAIFVVFFVSSLVSMTHAPTEALIEVDKKL